MGSSAIVSLRMCLSDVDDVGTVAPCTTVSKELKRKASIASLLGEYEGEEKADRPSVWAAILRTWPTRGQGETDNEN